MLQFNLIFPNILICEGLSLHERSSYKCSCLSVFDMSYVNVFDGLGEYV